MTHHRRICYSLQGGDVVVVDEHPLNSVVEELRVVAFLTWKQKVTQTLVLCSSTEKAVQRMRCDVVPTHCTGCKLYSGRRV